MNKAVYKYRLNLQDFQIVSLPKDSKILSVANQYDKVVMYAEVDLKQTEEENVEVYIVGTGHPMPQEARYATFLGTVLMLNGRLVWHVYTRKEV